MRFITDNISYIFNNLCDKILFASEIDKTNSAKHISYKRKSSDFIDFLGNDPQVSSKLLEIYETAIEKKRK
jgi:hypothetical protein